MLITDTNTTSALLIKCRHEFHSFIPSPIDSLTCESTLIHAISSKPVKYSSDWPVYTDEGGHYSSISPLTMRTQAHMRKKRVVFWNEIFDTLLNSANGIASNPIIPNEENNPSKTGTDKIVQNNVIQPWILNIFIGFLAFFVLLSIILAVVLIRKRCK